MNSTPGLVKELMVFKKEDCFNDENPFIEPPSLSEKYCIFFLQNPDDLGKKYAVPILYLPFEPDEKIVPVLKEFSHSGTKINRVYFGNEKDVLLVNTKNGGRIMAFSLKNFARKRNLPAPSPANAEIFEHLIRVSKDCQKLKTIIYLPL